MDNAQKNNHASTPMGMPRSTLMGTMGDNSFITMAVAQGIALVFTLVEVMGATLFTPMILAGYQHAGLMGEQLPFLLRSVKWLNWYGQAAAILVLNALIFWLFYGLAKKSWVGLAFLPSLIYTFIALFMSIAFIAPLLGVY